MKRVLFKLFYWSWIISLPVVMAGAYLTYRTIDQYSTFEIRYDPKPFALKLTSLAKYQYGVLVQRIYSALYSSEDRKTRLESVQLYVQESGLSTLNERLPQSGFQYIKGRMLNDGVLQEVKIKYRGDYIYHWGYDKKSLRVKTKKKKLYQGLRSFNLQAPKFSEQLNNYLSYRLSESMGLLTPQTRMARVFINGEDRGVHILIEQLEEMLLRRSGVMPGDVYRGEIVGKDNFDGSKLGSLFQSTAVWDKMAVNNHYDADHNAPLTRLLSLIQDRNLSKSQAQLGELLDLEAWGRFSAFETLTQTRHFSMNHNWRLYYDPWKQKIVPIVWDPMGWAKAFRPKPGSEAQNEIIVSSLHHLLFMNGDFIRARSKALQEFFALKKDESFLAAVKDAVATMEYETRMDPWLNPPDPGRVSSEMRKLALDIRDIFASVKQEYMKKDSQLNYLVQADGVEIEVHDAMPVQRIQLSFDREIGELSKVNILYRGPQDVEISRDVRGAVSVKGNRIIVETGLIANMNTYAKSPGKKYPRRGMKVTPGYYKLSLDGDVLSHLIDIQADRGNGWGRANKVAAINPAVFETLHGVIPERSLQLPLIWSGEVTVTGVQTIDRPLLIQPGTTVYMDTGASLILRQQLIAEGTADRLIRFVPLTQGQQPWGTVVLMGQGSNGSTLSQFEMSGGSGLKGELFEYTGMFSIHDVQKVTVSDGLFRDNQIVDDMVHTVYADVQFNRCTFRGAFADALDVDISNTVITKSVFENSGNDGVDMMSTQALITDSVFRNNGDKGISVGEDSRLLAIDDRLSGNLIGIQAKDESLAILFNQTLTDNDQALHAYKKNWRYGAGGDIYISKSRIRGNNKPLAADKHSSILLFDSFVDRPLKKKRITAIKVEDRNPAVAAAPGVYLPRSGPRRVELAQALQAFGSEALKTGSKKRRGAQ